MQLIKRTICTEVVTPSPGDPHGYGSSIIWGDPNMPPFTTYELILDIGGVLGSSSAENGVSLIVDQPCVAPQFSECDRDENLHLVLTD